MLGGKQRTIGVECTAAVALCPHLWCSCTPCHGHSHCEAPFPRMTQYYKLDGGQAEGGKRSPSKVYRASAFLQLGSEERAEAAGL